MMGLRIHFLSIVLILSLLFSCSERREARIKALDDAGLIVMEEPELIPIVQTLLDLDEQLADVNSSLRGEGGDFQNTLNDLNATLGDIHIQMESLKEQLDQQEQIVRSLRTDYEASLLPGKQDQAENDLP